MAILINRFGQLLIQCDECSSNETTALFKQSTNEEARASMNPKGWGEIVLRWKGKTYRNDICSDCAKEHVDKQEG